MSGAAKPVRPSKASKRDVIVIDDDDFTSEQPAVKSAKKESEAVSCVEVVKLQQKVLKLENMFQLACRAARTAELRAEAAESRLDATYGMKDDFNNHFNAEKKRAEELELRLTASTRLEEANRKAESNINLELAVENEALKAEKAKMSKENEKAKDGLKTQIATMGEEHKQIVDKLESRLNEVSLLLEEETRRVSELTGQNADLQRSDCERQKRNGELQQKLAQYEVALQPLLQLQQSNLQHPVAMPEPEGAAITAADIVSSDTVAAVAEGSRMTGHPLADSDLSEKLLDLVQKALNCGQFKRGTKRVEKALNRGISELIIFAADIIRPKRILSLTALCEQKNVPYVFVKGAAVIETRSSGGNHTRYAMCSITRVEGSQLESQICEIKKDVQNLH